MIRVEITSDEIETGLARISASLGDLTELMQDIGELLANSTEERFQEGAGPDGTPWAPKSQTTIDRYRTNESLGTNASIPFQPLIGASRRLSSEIHYQVTARSVEIGSSLIYAAVQQFGAGKGAFGTAANNSPIPWGPIPARPFIGVSDEDETAVVATVDEWLARISGGA